MPSWRLVTGYAPHIAIAQNLTRDYIICGELCSFTGETRSQMLIRDTYTLTYMFVRVDVNTFANSVAIRSRIGGVNGNLLVPIGAGLTGAFEDTLSSDALVSGNLVSYQAITGAGAGFVGLEMLSTILSTLANNTPIIGGRAAGQGANLTRWLKISSRIEVDTAENTTKYTFRVASTMSNMRIYVETNACTAASTFITRNNGVNGAQSVIVPATTTGPFEDAVNSDNVLSGNTFNYQFTTGATGGSLALWTINIKSTSNGRQTAMGATLGGNIAFGTTWHNVLEDNRYATAVEGYVKLTMRLQRSAKNMLVLVATNTLDAACTFRLRRNGANGNNLTLDVPALSTGTFENLLVTEGIEATDEFNYKANVAGTVGSLQLSILGFELAQAAGPGPPAPPAGGAWQSKAVPVLVGGR